MLREVIEKLLAVRGYSCLSIILSDGATDRTNAVEVLKLGLVKAKRLIQSSRIPEDEKNGLLKKMESIPPRFSINPTPGIGIFISALDYQVIHFPFDVKPRISIANSFDSRDLLYLLDYLAPYLVVSVKKNEMRLLTGEKDELTEVMTEDFPVPVPDDYEYNRPNIASSDSYSPKSFENDKSTMTSLRIRTMMKVADQRLQHHVAPDQVVIVVGIQRLIADFLEITKLPKENLILLVGSYTHRTKASLGQKCWEALGRHREKFREHVIEELSESDNGHLAKGVEHSWQAVNEGKGLILAVEKDFHCQGYLDESQKLLMNAPPMPFTVVADVVSELIENARKKHVKVIIFGNNKLRNFGHVAVQFRY